MAVKPSVSVVLPVHNGERFLGRALDSVRAQTLEDFECVVVDDGSTDRTAEILRQYGLQDQRLRVHRQEHRGVVAALNAGCQLAEGTYLARLDADDIASPQRLRDQVRFLERHPQVGVVGAGIVVVDEQDRPLFRVQYPATDPEVRRALLSSSAFAHPVVMMRKDVFVATGGYRAPFLHAEDFDLWLRISERCELANLRKSLLRHRFHRGSVSLNNLQQQVISVVGAELSGRMRASGQPDRLAGVGRVTLDVLLATSPEPDRVLSRVLELSASRGGFLVLVGAVDEALYLLQWARIATQGARLDRRARAKADMLDALAWYRHTSFRRSLAAAANALLTDPGLVFETVAHRSSSLLSSLAHSG